MGYLDYAGLQYLWGKLKEKFAPKSHSHDDRYYTESEMDGKLNSKVNNTKDGASSLINKLDSATGIPVDSAFFVSQYSDGTQSAYYRRPVSTLWTYIKGKADGIYQPKGSYASSGHTHSFSSITDKPSTYTPSAHNQSWSTITDKPALMESGDYSAETIEALLKQVQGLSPRMGSCRLTKDTHVANTWWNFIYTPHRTGSGGDNPEYGTLLLFPMVGAGSSYIVRAGKSGIVREVRKIYTSIDKPTKGDVGLGNVDNTADANKSVKYATSAGSASIATKATTAGTADKANALNPTFTFNCEGTNVTGYRLIGQVSIGQWSNYRCVMLVKSRHTGAGIVTVTIGNNTSSITQANAYAEIKYWGSTGSGGIISGSSYQVWVSADGKTGYLFWQHTDCSPVTIHVISSDFALKNGTWMTGIGTGYGKCIATTQINAASTANTANSAGSCTGNSASATKLTSSAGSATQPIYFKDGKPVAGTYTLGDASSKMVRTLGAVGNTGWANKTTDDKYVPTMSFMAYWNGAYSGTSSNLQYCDRGRFGTIVTKSIADFAPASGSNDYVRVYNSGTVSGTDNASINDLAKQHFAMAMVNNATDNPLGAKKWIHAINMAWNNGVNSSWVSQIALGVQDSYGMWFRTGQGAITGRAWNRVYDSSYHPDADHASAADSATNATNATTATKLSSNAGSSVQPVYFSGGKPVAIGYTISSSVPANAKFTDTTYGVASSSSNGLMSSTDKTKLDDFSRVINIQKQIKLTTDWLDTGIAGSSLDTGTYVVQVSGFNSSYTQLYSEIYSGVMSWYSGTTNSGNSSEIFLHNAGLADNNNAIYLRTLRVAGSKTLKLQIACKVAATGTDTLTFKFRRLI